MRAGLLIAALPALVLLASCGEAGSPVASEARASASEAATPLIGEFRAQSVTARGTVGDVAIERAGLIFANGVTLYTRALNPRSGGEAMARGGESYAAASLAPSDVVVELRRVTQQVVGPTAAARHGVCRSAEPPRYVAIIYARPAHAVTIITFAGQEAPGPDATDSRVCGVYAYTAPEGARTSAGIVL